MSGTVYLVGAGCGNPDLITWKGLRLLRACDAVLYDDLSSPKLLEETRTDCERLFVGKRYGRHSMPQAEINALLVAKAQEGKTVVRLKGGDPFVFGRGGEEVLALQAAGIPLREGKETLRASFFHRNTPEDVDRFVAVLAQCAREMRES